MITKENYFYFDIETAGKYKSFEDFEQADPRGAKLFAKKQSKKLDKDQNDFQWKGTPSVAYRKNASLIAEYGRIVCISYGFYSNGDLKIGTIKNDDEEALMKEARKVFDQVSAVGKILCGYNIKGFDMPWVYKKMISYKIFPSPCISTFNKKPWELNALDIMELWKGTSWEAVTFDEMTYALNISSPKSEMDGTQVHEYYHTGRIDEIVKYCERDVKALIDAAIEIEKLS